VATSGTFTYSATAAQAIQEALEILGVLESGRAPTTADQTSCLTTLNMMVKQWSGNFDFAPGLKAFARKRGYIFPQKNQGSYSLGPTGDNASLSYATTTMRVAGTAAATTLEVTSTTGMTAADKIGILLDSGTIQWTTVSSVTDSDTLVIPASGLTSAAAAGNRIFAYTTKLMRPLYIESAVLRDTDGNDSEMFPMLVDYYESLPAKSTDSDPGFYLYENSLTNGTLFLDYEPSDMTKVIRITFMAPAENYDAVANDIAYPQEWLAAIAIGLAKRVAPKFKVAWSNELESNYTEALRIARTSYAETSEEYFQPGLE
jgi:hypothetical protein